MKFQVLLFAAMAAASNAYTYSASYEGKQDGLCPDGNEFAGFEACVEGGIKTVEKISVDKQHIIVETESNLSLDKSVVSTASSKTTSLSGDGKNRQLQFGCGACPSNPPLYSFCFLWCGGGYRRLGESLTTDAKLADVSFITSKAGEIKAGIAKCLSKEFAAKPCLGTFDVDALTVIVS